MNDQGTSAHIRAVSVPLMAWAERQNPEVKRAAQRVLLGLWVCEHNNSPIDILRAGLVEDVATLEQAMNRHD